MFRLPETLLADRIPIEDHIEDNVLLMRGDGVLAMFDVGGVFPDTADDRDVADWFDQIHNAVKNIAADDIELTFYQCRGEMDGAAYVDGLHQCEFAQELASEYRKNLFRGTLYSNKLYFSIEVHAPNEATKTALKFVADASADPRAGITERKDRLNDLCDLLQVQLGAFQLRRLGYVTRKHLIFDEIAEAIVFAMTGIPRQIAATTGRMGNAMFSETIRFRRKRVEYHGAGDTTYGQMYAFKEYPATTWPGMFHIMATAPYRNTLMQSFRFLSNADAVTAVGRKQNRMLIAGDKAASQTKELDLAADDLLSRKYVLGDHSLVLLSFADSPKAMSEVGNASWRDLASCGLVATRMTKALQAAFLSMLPGGGTWRPRPGFVKSKNLVAFSPLYNWPAGRLHGHWDGPPIATIRTMAGTPYWFHWHVEDVGSTLITGAPGGGKAQPMDAKVLTPTGFRLMGDIRVGDPVVTPTGDVTQVTGVFPQGPKQIFKVNFSDGRTVECCDDHLWKVWSPDSKFETGKSHATRKRFGRDWSVRPLSEVRKLLNAGRGQRIRTAIPLVEPFSIEHPPQTLPIAPYVLGALLGDGCVRNATSYISSADSHILDRIRSELPNYELTYASKYDYRIKVEDRRQGINERRSTSLAVANERINDSFSVSVNKDGRLIARTKVRGVRGSPNLISFNGETRSMKEWAKSIGTYPAKILGRLAHRRLDEILSGEPLSPIAKGGSHPSPLIDHMRSLGIFGKYAHEKSVPEIYKRGSVAQRLDLLQGLMDTDGSVAGAAKSHATFTSTSKQLSEDVQEIAWSLGAIAHIRPRQTYFTYKGERKAGRPSWRVSIVMPDISSIFSLPRKVAECRPKKMRHRLRIKSIDPVGIKEAQCISVSHPDHLYVTDQYVVTHNTLTTGFLIAMTASRARIVALDHKRGWQFLIEHMGGDYAVLGAGEPHFSPLKALDHTPANIEFLTDLLRGCIGGVMTEEEGRRLSIGISVVMTLPREDRCIGEVRAFLDNEAEGAGVRLDKWCWGNELGWVIDAPKDTVSFGDLTGLDVTSLLNNPRARGPGLLYLFHRISLLLDGTPLLVPIDEGWRALDDPIFRHAIENALRTIRSKGGVLVFITQSPADIVESGIARVLTEMCPTQLHFPNPKGTREDYVVGLKMTEGQWQALRPLQKGQGLFLLIQGELGIVGQLPLGGMDRFIKVLSAREADLKRVDRERSQAAALEDERVAA